MGALFDFKCGSYSTLNVDMIEHWSMFVMLMEKNASLCGLFHCSHSTTANLGLVTHSGVIVKLPSNIG